MKLTPIIILILVLLPSVLADVDVKVNITSQHLYVCVSNHCKELEDDLPWNITAYNHSFQTQFDDEYFAYNYSSNGNIECGQMNVDIPSFNFTCSPTFTTPTCPAVPACPACPSCPTNNDTIALRLADTIDKKLNPVEESSSSSDVDWEEWYPYIALLLVAVVLYFSYTLWFKKGGNNNAQDFEDSVPPPQPRRRVQPPPQHFQQQYDYQPQQQQFMQPRVHRPPVVQNAYNDDQLHVKLDERKREKQFAQDLTGPKQSVVNPVDLGEDEFAELLKQR